MYRERITDTFARERIRNRLHEVSLLERVGALYDIIYYEYRYIARSQFNFTFVIVSILFHNAYILERSENSIHALRRIFHFMLEKTMRDAESVSCINITLRDQSKLSTNARGTDHNKSSIVQAAYKFSRICAAFYLQ